MMRLRNIVSLIGILLSSASYADSDNAVFLYDAAGNSLLSTSNALNAFITNTVAVTQSGTWTTGRTWTLLNSSDSITSFQGGTWTVQQGTPPWSVSQSGTWTTGRTWTLASGTDSVTSVQGTSPWVTNITQFGSVNLSTGVGASGTGIPRVTVSNDSNVLVTQSTSPWVTNISQFGGTNVSTGTGASGTGIPRVTVANDSNVLATQSGTWTVQQGGTPTTVANSWPIKVTDGTNTAKVLAASTQGAITDTALEVTERPDNVGTVTQTSVSCAATSTTLLAGGTATMFLSVRNPTTSTNTIWIQFNGSAATAAVPSVDLPPGAEADFFAEGPSFLPSSQFNCISGGSASSVALYYK